MVLDEHIADAAYNGDYDVIKIWLRALDVHPEARNEVDADGMTVLNLL